ncbi:MAG: hypothetical protein LBF68_00355 [Christensenellaceae bacterium]|nr:hypothetical protein [Christensenellaceae bacterium]
MLNIIIDVFVTIRIGVSVNKPVGMVGEYPLSAMTDYVCIKIQGVTTLYTYSFSLNYLLGTYQAIVQTDYYYHIVLVE